MEKVICSCGNDKWLYQYSTIGTGTTWEVYGCTNCSNTHTVELKEETISSEGVELFE